MKYKLQGFAKALFWTFVISLAVASQMHNSTRFRELQNEVNKLKATSAYIKVEDTQKPIKKGKRVK